jgi:hypothetical protein
MYERILAEWVTANIWFKSYPLASLAVITLLYLTYKGIPWYIKRRDKVVEIEEAAKEHTRVNIERIQSDVADQRRELIGTTTAIESLTRELKVTNASIGAHHTNNGIHTPCGDLVMLDVHTETHRKIESDIGELKTSRTDLYDKYNILATKIHGRQAT